jgi:TonB family protein
MAMTEIPPVYGVEDEPGPDRHAVPVLLIQLQDDLARSRKREAFWISLVFHLLLVITIVAAPKYWPAGHTVVGLSSAEDMLRRQEMTYLELPPDQQKVTQPPRTNHISDKNRIATSRAPQIDQKTLDELRGLPGPPGAPGRPSPQSIAKASPPSQAGQPDRGQQAPPPVPPQANSSSNLTAQLQSPAQSPARSVFGNPTASPGAAIEQAARAAALSRGGGGGVSGDYGLGGRGQGAIRGQLDVLSDTMGVDFGPYLQRVLHDVRENWYQLIPEVARAPLMKRGKVSIEFAITKNGQVAGMRLVGPSGDISLDRAAWGGITASNPFPPLPAEFRGSYLALRFHFFYNPDRHDLE